MSRKQWALTIGGFLLLGGGGYGACTAITVDEQVVAGVSIDPGEQFGPTTPIPEMVVDAGSRYEPPAEPPSNPDQQPGVNCGAEECPAGYVCCFSTGECMPADCEDCCGEMEAPRPPLAPPGALAIEGGPDDDPRPVPPGPGPGPDPMPLPDDLPTQ